MRDLTVADLKPRRPGWMPGVDHVDASPRRGAFWIARVQMPDGPIRTRSFAVGRYGEAEAQRLAEQERLRMLDPLERSPPRRPETVVLPALRAAPYSAGDSGRRQRSPMSVHVAYTQAGRMMAVRTVLGEDALLLERLEVQEGVSQLFTIRATVRAQREAVRPDEIVGTSADLFLTLSDGTRRVWNGLVTELHEGPIVTRGARQYALTLRPRLWLMSQRADCRIFLTQSTLQVIETLCSEHGIVDYDLAGVTGQVAKLDYVVQWNETDLAYMLRRMEESGLFFYFDHAEGKHTLVVGDHAYAYRDGEPSQVRTRSARRMASTSTTGAGS